MTSVNHETKKKKSTGSATVSLRRRSEAILRKKQAGRPKAELPTKPEEIAQAFHELQVHQIELEVQNEELQRVQQELEASRKRYFDLYDLAPVGYITIDQAGMLREINLTACELMGEERKKMVGQPFSRFVSREDQDSYYLHRRALKNPGDVAECELRLSPVGGKAFWAQLSSKLEKDETGRMEHRLTLHDISARKTLEFELYFEKEQFRTMLLSLGDGVIATDDKGRILVLNSVAEGLTGWSMAEAHGRMVTDVYVIEDGMSDERRSNLMDGVLARGLTAELSRDALLVSRSGERIAVEGVAAPINDAYGRIKGAVSVFRDCTEKRQHVEKIKYLSFHDQLTGLYNRRYYEEELRRLNTARNLPLTVIIADVNGLKLTNDAFGHNTGDELLKTVARLMQQACRSDEIVARIGGDEFAIVLPKTGPEKAQLLIERIQKTAAEEKINSIGVSVAFGSATRSTEGESLQDILATAEEVMYRDKMLAGPSIVHRTAHAVIGALFDEFRQERGHSQRVSALSERLGAALDLPPAKTKELNVLGFMHDIGKIGIDSRLLRLNTQLSNVELEEIRRHSEVGFRILRGFAEMTDVAEYVLCHHERWDGTGYPRGLKGEEIPLEARIVAIVEAYDAMTDASTYRDPLSIEEAVEELKKNAGTQFDPELTRVFAENVLRKCGVKT